MTGNGGKAIGLVRRDVRASTDIHALAERHGFTLVFTVVLDTGPLVSALVIAQHVYEYSAAAIVVPTFAHADRERHMITDLAALITPVRFYPRGFRWPAPEVENGLGS
ncbi:hypothetical protein [Nocardia sp. NPDC019395]|uniref:hypothetical protein n=1 Tax=Nocardia sp. NPDC019395 TaxID=3154686 RepID=UPI00340AAE29